MGRTGPAWTRRSRWKGQNQEGYNPVASTKAVKHLPKHLRPRWRYVVVELETWPDADLDGSSLQQSVWSSARHLLGDARSADADLELLRSRFWRGGGEAMFRVRRGEVDRARAALACVESVHSAPVGIAVRGVSGTIRAAEEKYIHGPPEPMREDQVVYDNRTRQAVVTGDRVDVAVTGSYVGATERDLE